MDKAREGDELSAAAWNRMVEAAEFYHRNMARGQSKATAQSSGDTGIVKVKNVSGVNLKQGAILEFTGFALDAPSIPEKTSIWLKGGEPTLVNGFGILLQPLFNSSGAEPGIGDCQVAGACVALVNVTDADHKFAEVESGEYVLQSSSSGSIRILHKPSGTGEKACVVLLGATSVPMFRGEADEDAAADETKTVNRFDPGTTDDSGEDDEVVYELGSVSEGDTVYYMREGDKLYAIAAECTEPEDTNPLTTLGDTLYGGAAGVQTRLAGNTTTNRKFMRQTGDGAASAAPAWDTVTKTDVGLPNVENTALSTWAGSGNLTTLGTITSGVWNGTAVAVANGGTGSTTASDARTALGLAIGTNVQAFDADLAALAANSTDGLWAHTGAGTGSARTITGTAQKITVTNGDGVAGNPTLTIASDYVGAVANGGTGATTAADARTNLGVVIGTHVQAWDTQLDSLAALSYTGNGGKVVAVNVAANAFELITAGGATFANPTASLGLTAINGSSTDAMRSDAAPALNQGIVPTWTGAHTHTALATFRLSDAGTTNVVVPVNVTHITSGTAASGFGAAVNFKLEASDGSTYDAGNVTTIWSDATAASRKAIVKIHANSDSGAREGFRVAVSSDGLAAEIGFFGASAVKQTASDLAGVIAALQAYGLLT